MNIDDMYINDYDNYFKSIQVSIFGIIEIANKRVCEIEKAMVVADNSIQKQELQKLLGDTHCSTNDILMHVQNLKECVNNLLKYEDIYNNILNGSISDYGIENNTVSENSNSNVQVQANSNVVFSNEIVKSDTLVEESTNVEDVATTEEVVEENTDTEENATTEEAVEENTDTEEVATTEEAVEENTDTEEVATTEEVVEENIDTEENATTEEVVEENTDKEEVATTEEVVEENTDTEEVATNDEVVEENTDKEEADQNTNQLIIPDIVNTESSAVQDDSKNVEIENAPLIPLIQGGDSTVNIASETENTQSNSSLIFNKIDSDFPKVILVTTNQFSNLVLSLKVKEVLVNGKGLFNISNSSQNNVESADEKKARAEQMMSQVSVLYSQGKAAEAQKMMEEAKTLMNEVNNSSASNVVEFSNFTENSVENGVAYQKVA